MTTRARFVGIAIAASLGAGTALSGSAAASTHSSVVSHSSNSAQTRSATEAQRPLTSITGGTPMTQQGALRGIPVSSATPTANASTQALPALGIRLAVKAALQVIKKRSVSTYKAIISKVNAGKKAFVEWYEKNAPGWVKAVLPGVGAAAIYDAIKWVIGL